MQSLSAKTPDEIIPVVFDFTELTTSIDSIDSVTISIHTGIDAHVDTMKLGAATLQNAKVSQLVRNGVDGVVYILSAFINVGSAKYQLSAYLPVETPK